MKTSASNKLQALCVIAAAFALFSTPQASAQTPAKRLVTQAVDESHRATLQGNVHPMARTQFDQGALDDAQPINRIYLLLNRSTEQQAALDKLMLDQMDKNSASYHQWLTPEQYGTQFGPADEDVQVVKNWLSSQGFTGVKVSAGKTIVEFSGTVGTVRRAFSTDMHRFVVNGEQHFANVSDPKIPAALSSVVLGIPSLHNFRKQSHIRRFGKFRRDATTGEITPLFTFTDVNGTFFGMGPADFAKIYNIPAGADGTGQSIAIVARSNINPQDLADFRSMFGLPTLSVVNSLSSCTGATPQFCVILNGADPGLVSGDEGEADLDVEWSGAIAPKATIKFVVSESEQTDLVDGVDASALYIVDNNIAPVMSESFGSCEAANGTGGNAFQNALWQQAAAEGITVSVSAGDNGSAGCDDPNSESSAGQVAPAQGIAVSGTASTPFNVAVGGTDFDNSIGTFWNTTNTTTTTPVPASALGYIPEVPWNDSCATTGLTGCNTATTATNLNIVAGSGGPSKVYTKAQAPFQTDFGDATARDIPDVSFFAADGLNKSFYIVCESDEDIPGDTGCNLTKFVTTSPFHDFQTVGGTSASAPAFAGVMALVNQKTGQRQGNANFVLYTLAKNETFSACNSNSVTTPITQPSTCVFMDITKSNNAVACVGGTPNCGKTSAGGNGVLVSNGVPAFSAATGYDSATGLGSINVTALLNNWASPMLKTTSTTISPTTTITTTVGGSVTVSGTVTSGQGTPTGLVIIENAVTGAPIDTATLSGTSYTLSNSTFFPGGNYTIKAHYGGDGAFGVSDSGPVTVNSTKANSKVIVSFVNANGQLVTGAQSVQYGSPYILRIDVTNSSNTPCENLNTGVVSFICPTGTITMKDGANNLNDFPQAQTPNATNVANLNDRGFIEDQPIQLNAGAHNITATYSGDASYTGPVTSSGLSITITQAPTQTFFSASPTVITSGGAIVLFASVGSNSNATTSGAPSGTVQFFNGSTAIGAPVNCKQAGASQTAGASCSAQLSTTLTALLPPVAFNDRWRPTPFELLAALMAIVAIILFLAATRLRGRRRIYAYGVIALFLAASAALAGCGGGSSGGGGGGSGHALSITAKYSGDTNYSSSQGSGAVTVQ